jgi:cob(I)alamin adenosyltransferase
MNVHYKTILAEIQDRLYYWAILATPQEKKYWKNGELRLQKLGILDSEL